VLRNNLSPAILILFFIIPFDEGLRYFSSQIH